MIIINNSSAFDSIGSFFIKKITNIIVPYLGFSFFSFIFFYGIGITSIYLLYSLTLLLPITSVIISLNSLRNIYHRIFSFSGTIIIVSENEKTYDLMLNDILFVHINVQDMEINLLYQTKGFFKKTELILVSDSKVLTDIIDIFQRGQIEGQYEFKIKQ